MTANLIIAKAESPKTLLKLSGVAKPEIRLENAVVIVIDAQQEYLTGRLPLSGMTNAVLSIKAILLAARKKKAPIFHIRHRGTTDALFDYESIGFQHIPELDARPDEKIILKQLPDSFAGTTFAADLEQYRESKNLILVGFMTHMCITNTAVTALNLGFQTVVINDAVATRDLRGPDGETILAADVNQTSLAALQDRMAWVISSKELLS